MYEIMLRSPILTVVMFFMFLSFLYRCFVWLMRHLNIKKHGWPPPHCDADGDFRLGNEE